MSDDYEILDEYERQAYQAAIYLGQDLEDFAADSGDRTVVNWIKSKHAAHAQSLYNFNEILDLDKD